ncbi:MAG: hypothetical protein ACREFC_15375 [Stellaceae bacterium]
MKFFYSTRFARLVTHFCSTFVAFSIMVSVFRRLMGVKHGSEEESSEEEDREEGQEALVWPDRVLSNRSRGSESAAAFAFQRFSATSA